MAKPLRNKKGQFLKSTAKRSKAVARGSSSKSSHKRSRTKISIALVAGLLPGAANVWGGFKAGGLEGAAQTAAVIYTGLDPQTGQWNLAWMGRGTIPILAGFLVSRIASRIGVNRALGRLGLPVRI